MLKLIKNTVFSRLIIWLLLIQMINICTDPVDKLCINKSGNFTTEDLSINEIESIFEFVSESYFHTDIPEHDENDEDGFYKYFLFVLTNQIPLSTEKNIHFWYQKQLIGHQQDFFEYYCLDKDSPPPQVV